MRSRSLGYRPELDGVRAVAIIAVVIAHAKLWFPSAPTYWGARGVDLFFVLSGFLITSLLYREHATQGGIHRGFFYMRRALRLLPALALALIIGAIAAHLLGGNGKGMLPYGRSAVAAIFFEGNWFKWKLGILDHTWSLGLEEQFYLLWPLVMAIGLRRMKSARTFVAILGIGAVAVTGLGVAYNYHLVHGFWPNADVAPWDRAGGLLIGSALGLALASDERGTLRRLFRDPALPLAAGTAIVGIAAVTALRPPNDPGAYDLLFLLDVCFALVIGHLFVAETSAVAKVFRLQPLPRIGRISYGMYLVHWPLFVLLAAQKGSPVRMYSYAVALTLVIAAASYALIERPILGLKDRIEARKPKPEPIRAAKPLQPVRRVLAPAPGRVNRKPVRPTRRPVPQRKAA